MTIQQYIDTVNTRYKQGNTTEHSFRGDLQNLLETLLPNAQVTNEPRRIDCGAPDYIITSKGIPAGYIEAKDLGADLNHKTYQEQFKRYKDALSNLIITNYLDFQVYKDGALVASYSLGMIEGGKVVANKGQFDAFTAFIPGFAIPTGQTIKVASKLAAMMAGKAKMLAAVIEKALDSDEETKDDSTLKDQLKAFKDILIHDITAKGFADIYAQTIAYGMFAARLHDPSLESFTRQEAAELIPKTNPFLRKLFQYIAGYDLDSRIAWIVDALADIFRATDVKAMLTNFGKSTQQTDPIIHFYETFLSEYDPKLRKARGVWYTPEPVVKFIVRAVDDILKTEFGLPDGLADNSKTKVKVKVPTHDKRYAAGMRDYEQEVHKVQILDPATGTATFLAEVVKYIYSTKFQAQQGIWSSYVEEHLIPRINGFELLMASYAMAHLKLDLLLTETGYKPKKEQRLRIYLTNSLEESHPDTGTLFANWLSSEANEANQIKRDTPVMVVMGNPPYSGESANKGEWIMKLMEDYKYEPGGKEKLKERNPKWINGDENKFIRFGQYFIEKNGSGILAFINPHSFLDNPTFRGMRWNLLKTFDKIYTIDLHGNSKKKEVSPDGSPDVNVFDIQQGVSINLFIKTGKKKPDELGNVFHYDLYGKREIKYNFLFDNSVKDIQFNKLNNTAPNYLFKPQDELFVVSYQKGINPIELFKINVMGFQTHRDNFAIGWTKKEIEERAFTLRDKQIDDATIQQQYDIKDNRDWQLANARKEIQSDVSWENNIATIAYRPFDNRQSYFSTVMMDYPRKELLQHVSNKDNLIIGIGRQGLAVGDIQWCLITVSKFSVDANVFRRGGVNLFPLYLYTNSSKQISIEQPVDRNPNLNTVIIKNIADNLGLQFTPEKEQTAYTFAPIDILDYIYAILHSPAYRERYKEFLKIDFPRVPYPKDTATFWALVKLGGEIRQLHLMESPALSKLITKYPTDGDNSVGKIKYEGGRVYINDAQYFDGVPKTAWEFYIGGYQPAQKWLKDRKDRQLSFDDILRYQKIIVALTETDRLMKEIDKIDFL